MSDLILELGNAANWELLHSESRIAVKPSPSTHIPIVEMPVPILATSPIVAVYVDNPSAKPNWYTAGYILQKIRIGVVVGGQADTESITRRKVYLRQIQLAIFPTLQQNYQVVFRPAYWHDRIDLNFWQYTGPRSDTTIQALGQVLGRVESANTKLNILLDLEGINGGP